MSGYFRGAWPALPVHVTVVGAGVAGRTVQLTDTASAVIVFDSNPAGIRMRVQVGSIEFIPATTGKGEFAPARIDGFVPSGNLGEPNFPAANSLISIPPGCDLSARLEDFAAEEISVAEVGVTPPLMPVQPRHTAEILGIMRPQRREIRLDRWKDRL